MLGDNTGADPQWRGSALSLTEVQSTAGPDMQTAGDAQSISSVIPEPPQSDKPPSRKPRKKSKRTAPTPTPTLKTAASATPAAAKETKKDQKRIARAITLRKEYPNMQNIPKSITPSQRKKLILQHTQNPINTVQPTHTGTAKGPRDADSTLTAQSTNSMKAASKEAHKEANKEKQKNRASLLKQQYPDMEGIPSKIGRGIRKKLIAQYKARSSVLAPSVTILTSSDMIGRTNLPTRPVLPPTATSGMIGSQRPTSYKMAPLSEERRAEVARNLAAGSNSDPVMID